MAKGQIDKYIWLVDTIRRYGRITRKDIDGCWSRSQFGQGSKGIPRRTFCNYREAAENLFNVEIVCDPATFEYYISRDENEHSEGVTDWLLNTAVTNEVLSGSRDVSSKIFVENVPSAREFLAPVIDALRENRRIKFDYKPYTRSRATAGIVFEPYFLKIFRQRWYVTGRHVAENRIKTYALDRVTALNLLAEEFRPDPAFDADDYTRFSFGIVTAAGEPRDIELRVDPLQAKYFRTLPLHHSQQEFVHDDFSIFRYRMRLSPDLVSELLSYGSKIEVTAPQELRVMMAAEIRKTLDKYQPN